ncbi:carbohydrate ABC transporter permease [Streptomyces sp. DSM 41982]|uniref:Carbohydrate ABC transporter permease n=1 Tax=Streptomyces evansiae TaxID=3075535 RepID=A0ABD5E192_9ACTN|nr:MULTISPECIES: carbohydrate ABC transporter permease [unclassified Streptomyces]MDT0415206.1 carbohydrate ABC transporter permease [Streptomyces sp. DSM 41982]SCD61963.1 carbohydrate ABC transporter membrane protein 2, CUT1 family [Streptomyces sp. SolWspMP-sol7th]
MTTLTGRRSPVRTVLALLIVAVMPFPLYWMVNASFRTNEQLARRSALWFPLGGTLHGYRDAFAQQGGHLLASLVVALGATALTLLIAAPAAYALALLRAPGGKVLLSVLLVVQLVPGIVMANALYEIFGPAHLLDSAFALILADSTLAVPFAVLVLRAFMTSVPGELVEAAALDGAGAVRTFVTIVLPMARNALVTAGLFTFLFAWGDFMFATTLTPDSGTWQPITVGLYDYIGAGTNTTSWNSVMATAVIASLPAAVLLVVAQRHVAAGLTSGAVKD